MIPNDSGQQVIPNDGGRMQVYEMDSKLLDARRPKVAKPTAEHREERLLPYAAQVCALSSHFGLHALDVMLTMRCNAHCLHSRCVHSGCNAMLTM